ncbi:hypothetical protein [Streptomyces californicus]|uniref:hypothetical protein n=1 Tax=Streptomyces californicus TaxID=67351 RepID=UPI00296F113E|nr:hypothetical protein [Streptomyces californicus]MDW4912476.1 hypothetical protein [Streptomyces californicus]
MTTTTPTAPVARISAMTDQQALWETQRAVTERLTQLLLAELEELLRPSIKQIRATGVWADFLIVRAGRHEATRQQPWPIRFSADDLHINWEPAGQLTIPADLRDDVDSIMQQLTQLHGGLTAGHDLPLRLPVHLY